MSEMLLFAENIEKAWADRAVLRGVSLTVERGEVVGLVGPNGCGKSTFLQILAREIDCDHGRIAYETTVGVLTQEPHLPKGTTVRQAAHAALAWHQELLTRWEQAVEAGDPAVIGPLQDRLDTVGWSLDHQVESVLDRLNCPDPETLVDPLSGGELRRVALARALLSSPDLLLLDEPTNHLDADTVEWLESFLGAFAGGVVLVTHDRYLLEAVATRIVEIDDGVGVSYDGSYADYLVQRAERQAALMKADDNRLAMITQEAEWASRSPKARSVKQKARLQRLDALRALRPIKKEEQFSLDLRTGTKFGRTFLETRGLRKSFGDRLILAGLDLDIGPGERLGIVGPNGVGKSTLLNLITGALPADKGTVQRAPRLQIAVLDQHRTGLDPKMTVFEAGGNGNDRLTIGDDTVHVATFLRRFLFPREQLSHKVAGLSGGEKARLLLARLLLRGANLLLLDEPTNDLDLMTLRVLEEALLAFDGAAIIVTHDRAFLDRVCTAVLAFEPGGQVTRYADRTQWLRAHQARMDADRAAAAAPVKVVAPKAAAPKAPEPAKAAASKSKLTFKERKELEELPAKIEALEQEQRRIEVLLADPATWKLRAAEAPTMQARLAALGGELETVFARWSDLDARG